MPKVLVVDDDPSVAATLVRMLEGGGYKAVPCSGVEVGLAIIDHEAFDIVLTDVHMPNLNGADLTLQVRAMFPDLPVIAMSGRAGASLELCGRLGAADIIMKPFRAQELFATIERALSTKSGASRHVKRAG